MTAALRGAAEWYRLRYFTKDSAAPLLHLIGIVGISSYLGEAVRHSSLENAKKEQARAVLQGLEQELTSKQQAVQSNTQQLVEYQGRLSEALSFIEIAKHRIKELETKSEALEQAAKEAEEKLQHRKAELEDSAHH